MARLAARERSPGLVKVSVVEVAVSSERLLVLVEVVSVEHLALLTIFAFGIGEILQQGVVAADLWVERTREETRAHPVLAIVDAFSVAVLWRTPWVVWPAWGAGGGWLGSRARGGWDWDGRGRSHDWWSAVWRCGDVGLVIAIGACDDDFELLARLTSVGGH